MMAKPLVLVNDGHGFQDALCGRGRLIALLVELGIGKTRTGLVLLLGSGTPAIVATGTQA